MKILFVCTGNICRSPTADGILRAINSFDVDSCAIFDYHVGEPPDPRSIKHAKRHGFDISNLRARQIEQRDFIEFDLILAMDKSHLKHLKAMCPTQHQNKLHLFLEYVGHPTLTEVPDPYYGTSEDFEFVFKLIEDSVKTLCKKIKT